MDNKNALVGLLVALSFAYMEHQTLAVQDRSCIPNRVDLAEMSTIELENVVVTGIRWGHHLRRRIICGDSEVKVYIEFDHRDITGRSRGWVEESSGPLPMNPEEYFDLWVELKEVCMLDPGYLWNWRHLIDLKNVDKVPRHGRYAERYTTTGAALQIVRLELRAGGRSFGFVQIDPLYLKDQRYQEAIDRVDTALDTDGFIGRTLPWLKGGEER